MTNKSKQLYIKLSNNENYFNYFLLALTVCFVYSTCQKAIKNLKNKYKKESLTKQSKVGKKI